MKHKSVIIILLITAVFFSTTVSAQVMKDWFKKKQQQQTAPAQQQQQSTQPTTTEQPPVMRSSSGMAKFKVFSYADEMSGIWAFKLLIPEGWHVNGGINWLPQPQILMQKVFQVESADKSSAMNVMPEQQIFWSTDPTVNQTLQSQGLQVAQPMNAVQYIENFLVAQLKNHVQNLQVVNRKQMPEVAQALTSALGQIVQSNQCAAQLMGAYQIQYDVGQVDMTYTYNGTKYFQTYITRLIYASNQMQAIGMWGPEQTVSFYTPEAQKQENLEKFVIMSSSMYDNPVFLNKVCQITLMIMQQQLQQIRSAGELSQYISRTYNDISNMVSQSYQAKDAAYDRVFDNWADYMRDVDTWQDNEFTLKIPNNYTRVWRQNNEVVMTNDMNFDPNRDMNGSWTPMNQRR